MGFNCVLVKVSPEISLKTRFVRKFFLAKLVSNLKTVFRASAVSGTRVEKASGRLFVFPENKKNLGLIFGLFGFVFGVQSRAMAIGFGFSSKEELVEKAVEAAKPFLKKGTFKVDARREGFLGFSSKALEEILGSRFLAQVKGLKVDLSRPKQTVFVEVIKDKVFVYHELSEGSGGLPLGCEGSVAVFFEGKKEELVAAFLMMKRGCNVFPVAKKWSLKLKKHVGLLSKWNSFRSFRFSLLEELSLLNQKPDIFVKAIVFADCNFGKKMFEEKNSFGLAVFWPLVFLPKEELDFVVQKVLA